MKIFDHLFLFASATIIHRSSAMDNFCFSSALLAPFLRFLLAKECHEQGTSLNHTKNSME
jgi:hypothetical protein